MILAIDPSGNFNEGKGITGWVALNEKTGEIFRFGSLDAGTCLSMEEHWQRHLDLIDQYIKYNNDLTIIIEDYMLYANKAMTQVNSRFETPKLIGVIQHYCYQRGVTLHFQTAVTVQRRWKNFLLERKGFLTIKEYVKNGKTYEMTYIGTFKVNDHIVDALKHAVHFYFFHVQGGKSDTQTESISEEYQRSE